MIVGIDHITFSTTNIRRDIMNFKSKGFDVLFNDFNIDNALVKKNLLQNYAQYQSIALLSKKDSLKIELVADTTLQQGISNIEPIIDQYGGGNWSLLGIEIKVYNKESFVMEWLNYGFKQIDENTLEIKSLLSGGKTYIVKMKTVNKLEDYYLDNHGYTALAMVSSSLERDYGILKNQGLYVTDIEEIWLNNNKKKVKVFFLKGSNNEIIEFIGVK